MDAQTFHKKLEEIGKELQKGSLTEKTGTIIPIDELQQKIKEDYPEIVMLFQELSREELLISAVIVFGMLMNDKKEKI